MTNKKFYEFIMSLDKIEPFQKCLPLTDRRTDEQYRIELLLRLLIPFYIDWSNISKYNDFAELLDKETISLCEQELSHDEIEFNINSVFELLERILGEDAFKKFNGVKHSGPVMAAAFQVIACGIYKNIHFLLKQPNDWIKKKIQNIYEEDVFKRNTTPGVRSIPRFKELSQFGVEYFKS